MIGDNIIAYDCLESDKTSVKELTAAIIETGNQNLKQTFVQMRDQAEQDQKRVYHIAEQNGWYPSPGKADPQQISDFYNFFQQNYQVAQQPNYQQQNYQTNYQQQRGFVTNTGQQNRTYQPSETNYPY